MRSTLAKFGTCACELGERRDTVGGPALAPLILGNIANRGDDVGPSQAERTEPHCSVVLPKIRPVHKLHREIRSALVLADVVDRCDIRLMNPREQLGFRLVSHLAFVKNVWGLGRFTRGQHETAFLLAKGQPARPANGISDVIEWQRESDAFHPNQKPVHALYPLLTTFAPANGIILDPFMGSGSTLRAAKDMGLRAVGIEIEEHYCRRAAARLAQEILFTRREIGPDEGGSHVTNK